MKVSTWIMIAIVLIGGYFIPESQINSEEMSILEWVVLIPAIILLFKFSWWFMRNILPILTIGILSLLLGSYVGGFSNPQSERKRSKRETGFAVYRIYGSNRTYLGTWSASNMAISNAKGALRRSSKNTAVVVIDKETGGTVWSDNK